MKFKYLGFAEIESIANPYEKVVAILKAQIELLELAQTGNLTTDGGQNWEPVNSNKQVEIEERLKLINYFDSIKNNHLGAKASK